jgi:hypothetical protein
MGSMRSKGWMYFTKRQILIICLWFVVCCLLLEQTSTIKPLNFKPAKRFKPYIIQNQVNVFCTLKAACIYKFRFLTDCICNDFFQLTIEILAIRYDFTIIIISHG